ncbi:MAG: hypothetical protein JWN79_2730 [Gemmatimonadetes bacterium]|jgi:hypothetical protein|nr:hypothetical protein [Gemmatimonadota bacterium]
MSLTEPNKRPRRSERPGTRARIAIPTSGSLPAIGLEAEFTTIVDGVHQKPEDVFGSPRHIVRGPLVHRTGRSYHLPTGGALYFDTGVMEIATPMIEIARGCGARGTRSLWESLGFLREELDGWEERTGREVRLVGFSAHYNVSFELPLAEQRHGRSVQQLAYLLTHILAAPVMMLAANRRSTGIGVRPRGNRIEITADFTPDAALMAATATLIVGIVREVMTWPAYSLDQLALHGIPVERSFVPVPHSSRKGWVAKDICFPTSPFTADVDGVKWHTRQGEHLSLREMAGRTTRYFWPAITALGDPLSLQLIAAVMRGRAPSLLELDDRPAAYDDVGRLCKWDDLFPVTLLPRSRYERVLRNAINGHRVRMGGSWHKPVGMKGWTHVVFRRERDGVRRVRSLDAMLEHLDAWDRTADRRSRDRRRTRSGPPRDERRTGERREPVEDTHERRRHGDLDVTPVAGSELVDSGGAAQLSKPDPASPSPDSAPARRHTPGRDDAPFVIITRTS